MRTDISEKTVFKENSIQNIMPLDELTVSNEAAIRMCEHLEKPNPRKCLKRKGIRHSFGYIDSEREVRIIKTNYAMG